jgi:twitching motility protein PilT
MRDFETIAAAVTAAETGHLVMSTLHTTGASETLDRIIDTYPPHAQGQCRSQLANNVVGIVSQTLVPTSDGQGRVAAMELLNSTDAISSLIREGKTYQIPSAIATGRAKGMFTLDQDLARLAAQGRITREEAMTRCQEPAEFVRYLDAAHMNLKTGQGVADTRVQRKTMDSSLLERERLLNG